MLRIGSQFSNQYVEVSVQHQVGQQLIIGISGQTLQKTEAEFIVKNNIGGVVLFSRNIANPEQVRSLCQEIQALRFKMPDKQPLFIGVDQEGGRVARLKAPFTVWPPMIKVGALDSTSVAFKVGNVIGTELKAVGINLDFAPCADILTNPTNTAIGDRSFGSNPEVVARIASAMARGFIKADVIPCIKHFPGHGNTIVDSHFELPIEDKTLEDLDAVELVPFKKALRTKLDFVMFAHIKYPKIDPQWPATLSPKFVEIARQNLRYRNLIITDDLDMKALTNNYDKKTIAVQAITAGANVLLYCNEPDSPVLALEGLHEAIGSGKISKNLIEQNYKKILETKAERIAQPEPLSEKEIKNIIGHPDHLRLAKAIADGHVPEELVGSKNES